jgi:ABC-2 type transport system permease protein
VLGVLAIARRDLDAYLKSFSFYLLVGFFLGASGYFFWSGLSYFSLLSFQIGNAPQAEFAALNLTESVLSPFLANMTVLLLLLVPVLAMRSFSEEKKLGTLELLFSYPISDFQIVLGKFLGLLAVMAILVVPTTVYFVSARLVGAAFEPIALLSGFLGLFLTGASFIAFAMFVSSLTEQQAVSAGIGFVVLLFFWIVGWIAEWTSPAISTVFSELALIAHMADLTVGVVDTKDLIYFLLFISFFMFATLCSLEVRTWKR